MGDRELWTDPDGVPLKFQYGDYVRIETADPAALPFLSGYVRGCDLSGTDGVYSASYDLFSMGNPPLPGMALERALTLAPDPFEGHVHQGRVCGICGHGGTPRGLAIFAGPKV